MPLSLAERQAVLRELAGPYRRARKHERSQILNHVQTLCGFNRAYAARALRTALPQERRPGPRSGRGRKPTYGLAAKAALIRCWAILNFPTGKRLQPFLPDLVAQLERHGELTLEPPVKHQLLAMSAASIDRFLAAERRRLEVKGRSGTKPGTLLKHQIPVRTWAEWDDATQPGFLEIDLVSHDGGAARGDFAWTLDMVDILTGWTETAAVPNKARKWILTALDAHRGQFPFPIRGIDSDNGSEFINHHLLTWCEDHHFTFTRSRAYHKNDGCYVEQKNWTVIRRYVGYVRYTGAEQVGWLNELYATLRLYTNFFQPLQKAVAKERRGARTYRRYDRAQTPYQRVMALPDSMISPDRKAALQAQYEALNPAALRRDLLGLQNRLWDRVPTDEAVPQGAPVI
ncbi:MAG: integrase [Sulfobacillus benefaciens]|uniref:Integrase n=1 Tax=Sulfobacillus benefaciens TaxID=453960 RepID=A0A2T2X304_9FIRM|nr:MAG: integrase [Sulfobacillus benefaciens]